MERLQRAAVLLSLVECLRENGSWGGETHIQKAAYFLKEMLGVPLDAEFVLYRYGPYSFDLDEQLVRMMADGVLKERLMPYPYGPKIELGALARQVMVKFPEEKEKYAKHISYIAKSLGSSNVADLERIATALFVTRGGNTGGDAGSRAKRLNEIKPHISLEDATAAVERVDAMMAKAKEFLSQNAPRFSYGESPPPSGQAQDGPHDQRDQKPPQRRGGARSASGAAPPLPLFPPAPPDDVQAQGDHAEDGQPLAGGALYGVLL
jgi:uncharacterized protein YwgA